jgi:hypothetical protein
MAELLPLTVGLLLGTAVGLRRPETGVLTIVLLAVPLGVMATVVTGEFKTSWGFLLIDIPLVAVAAAVAFVGVRMVSPARQRA